MDLWHRRTPLEPKVALATSTERRFDIKDGFLELLYDPFPLLIRDRITTGITSNGHELSTPVEHLVNATRNDSTNSFLSCIMGVDH
jgi:hypothetical protein